MTSKGRREFLRALCAFPLAATLPLREIVAPGAARAVLRPTPLTVAQVMAIWDRVMSPSDELFAGPWLLRHLE